MGERLRNGLDADARTRRGKAIVEVLSSRRYFVQFESHPRKRSRSFVPSLAGRTDIPTGEAGFERV